MLVSPARNRLGNARPQDFVPFPAWGEGDPSSRAINLQASGQEKSKKNPRKTE
jgi:DNA polymerase IIIc chi subunit